MSANQESDQALGFVTILAAKRPRSIRARNSPGFAAPQLYNEKHGKAIFNDRINEIQRNLDRLHEISEEKIRQVVAAIKAQAPIDGEAPNDEVRAAIREASKNALLMGVAKAHKGGWNLGC